MPKPATPRPIRFVHKGAVVQVQGPAITRTTLDWLREDARCTGTKEGCNEGDCGACTVVVAELDDGQASTAVKVGGLALRPVNACLRWLPTLDGKALLTVEDVAAIGQANGAALHPVQQAMVACHGSQCGFCTPGFVMSLFARYEAQCEAGGSPASRTQLADDLAGNLCRCTGYRPILDAGQQMMALPPARLDTAALREQLQRLAQASQEDGAGFAHESSNTAFGGRTDRFMAPRTLAQLAQLRKAHPQARLVAGATDIGLWVNKQFRDVGDVLYIGEVAELKRIEPIDDAVGAAKKGAVQARAAADASVCSNADLAAAPAGTPAWLSIGAGATLEDAWAALALHWPALNTLWRRFAGPPTRHAGTMGGNLANGSPIGDSAPVLMALGARLLLRRGRAQRRLALEDFYLGYMQNALTGGEFVQAIEVPLPGPARHFRAYKNSKRFDCDISALCAAFSLDIADGRVVQARIAFGGMAATVRRASGAEAALRGQTFNAHSIQAAMRALDEDFKPLTDLRASASYRQQVARNLLWRFWLETRPDQALKPIELDVFDPQHEASRA